MTNLISISAARASLSDIVAKISDGLDRVVITVNGQPKATLISAEELESLEETAEVMAIPGIIESITRARDDAKNGRGIPLADLK